MTSNIPSKALQLFTLESPYELAFPDQATHIHLDSPATAILTDFRTHPPATLYADDKLDDAQRFLANAHVSIMSVLDRSEHFRGLMTRERLSDESAMRLVSLGLRREDLQVSDLMIPRSQLMALDHDTLEQATVGRLITLLRQEGQPHVLVVDHYSPRIIGLISAVDLARQLHLAVEIQQQPCFMEIFDAVMR